MGQAFRRCRRRERDARSPSAIGQMLAVGVEAIPIVGVMAVYSGFILAMQGASELRQFGESWDGCQQGRTPRLCAARPGKAGAQAPPCPMA